MMESKPSRFDTGSTADRPASQPKRKSRFDAPAPISNLSSSANSRFDSIQHATTHESARIHHHQHRESTHQRTVSSSQGVSDQYYGKPSGLPSRYSETQCNKNTQAREEEGATQDGTGGAVDGQPMPHPLELCSVGAMMAALCKQKNLSGAEFVPYSALPSDVEVPTIVMPSVITEIDNTRVEDFYDRLEELLDSMDDSINMGDKLFNYSRRKHVNINKHRSMPLTVVSEKDIMRNRDGLHGDALASALRARSGFSNAPRTFEQSGQGMSAFVKAEDDFESFRKKRATQYHEHLAIKDVARKDPSIMLLSSQALCYKCNRPGHHAKDCSYIPA